MSLISPARTRIEQDISTLAHQALKLIYMLNGLSLCLKAQIPSYRMIGSGGKNLLCSGRLVKKIFSNSDHQYKYYDLEEIFGGSARGV